MSFYKGNDYYNKRMYREARAEYISAIKNGEEEKRSRYNLAVCFLKEKEYKKAFKILRRIREDFSEDVLCESDYNIVYNLALCLSRIALNEYDLEKINQAENIFKYAELNFKCTGCKQENFKHIYKVLSSSKQVISTANEVKSIAKDRGFDLKIESLSRV